MFKSDENKFSWEKIYKKSFTFAKWSVGIEVILLLIIFIGSVAYLAVTAII